MGWMLNLSCRRTLSGPGRVRRRPKGVHIRLSVAPNVCYPHASRSYLCSPGSTMPPAVIPRYALELSASRRAGSAKPSTSSTMRLSFLLSVNSPTQHPRDPVPRPKT
jgi:hypothetical protein